MSEYKYEYNGNTYTLKPDVLELYRDGIDIISARKKLIFEATHKIDRNIILKYEKELKELNRKKFTQAQKKKDVTGIEKQIEELEYKYETDSEVQSINVYVTGCVEDAMLKLVLDKELMSRVIPKLIDGDSSTFDFSDFKFIENVVSKAVIDFFFVTTQNRSI